MSLGAKREYRKAIRQRYLKASRREKSLILNEFCEVCGFSRKYAIRLLRAGFRKKQRPGPKRTYDGEFQEVLAEVWFLMRRMCSKKMVEALPIWLPFLEESLRFSEETKTKLLSISASSIDRLLRSLKNRKVKGISATKPGRFFKTKIPLSIAFEEIKEPGYVQCDTVAHCGSSLAGPHGNSVTVQ